MNKKLLYKILSFIFVLLLIVPCLGILREKRNIEFVAEMENRTINPKPTAALFTGSFFSEFEAWYNDRLLGRKDLIRLWSSINGRLFNTLISKEVALGKDGYLFFPFNLSVSIVDEDKKLRVLESINDICSKKGKRFTVFITPPSEWIFPELLSTKYKPVNVDNIEFETGILLKQRNIDYCFIAGEMLEMNLNERKSMYYEGDSHWNKKGGYYGARKLLIHLGINNKINNDIYYKQEIGFGDIYTRKIGWETIKSVVNVPWNVEFDDVIEEKCCISGQITSEMVKGAQQKGEVIYRNPNVGNNSKVLILGDSFLTAMTKYLMQDINTIIFSHNCSINSPKEYIDVSELIDRYQPDMVIYEKVGSNFYGHSFEPVFGYFKI